ncbi:MAG: PGPGW domain-containing protein [Planctomycetota bacterium]|nr:PGPGW domain-containing protein [Planctomycetota bacterium]
MSLLTELLSTDVLVFAEFTLSMGLVVTTLGASLLAMVAGIVVLPIVAVRLPADYFVRPHQSITAAPEGNGYLRWCLKILKNLLGATLLIAGVIMIVTPGPGMVALLVGLSLVDFPGKRALEIKLISTPNLHQSINKLRKRYGRPPLILPGDPPENAEAN